MRRSASEKFTADSISAGAGSMGACERKIPLTSAA